jgi:hypothetical protein
MPQPPVIAARTTLIPLWEQIVMYFGIVIGTIVSALLRGTIQVANPNNRLWVVIGLSCFIGLITMPYIYEKTRPDPNSPGLVRFALFVQNGFFWENLVEGLGGGIHV